MSALAFDPWAALKARNGAHPPPKAPNPANPGTAAGMAPGPNGAGLGGLAGLGGGCPAAAQNAAAPPGPGDAAGLIGQAAALGVRLEARPGGLLWADKPGLFPTALRDSLAAHRAVVVAWLAERHPVQALMRGALPPDATADRPRARGVGDHFPDHSENPSTALPGVPPDWCEGVRLLASRPAPQTIPPRRWAALAAASARLLRDHGAELHGARWDTIALFGLHAAAPAANPSGWGLAWLMGETGNVLDVFPDVVGMTREAGGAGLTYRRAHASARAGCVPAWNLPRVLE